MALPKNVIINIPIVASVVSDVPFDKENAFFEVGERTFQPFSPTEYKYNDLLTVFN